MRNFLKWEPLFDKDETAEGERQIRIISKTRGKLYLDMPFFGYILDFFELYPVDDSRVMTYAIDARIVYFNPDYIESMSPEEIKGMLMHLILHLILRHNEVAFNKDIDLWAMAADISSNLMLDEVLRENRYEWIIPDVSYYREFMGMQIGEIYDHLFEEFKDGVEEDMNRRSILKHIAQKHGIKLQCGFNKSLKQMYETIDKEKLEIQQDWFEVQVRNSYQKHKNNGSIPQRLKSYIEKTYHA